MTSHARFLLMPLGSHGDVLPFLGLGLRLAARGHEVVLATSEPFREAVVDAGLPFVGLGRDVDWDALLEDPELWHPTRSLGALARLAVLPRMREQADVVREHAAGGGTRVVGSSLGLGARASCEALGVPLATLHLQPSLLWSVHRSPRLAGALLADWVPRPLKQLQFALGRWAVLDPALLAGANAHRAELGLAPVRHVDQLFHAPARVVGMWPSWFGPPQPDWPPQVRLADFPLWDLGDAALDAELARWLDAGEAPVAFTFGTAMLHGHAAFAAAAEACRLLGRRGLLLARYPEQLPAELPPGVRHVEFAPFGALLPRVAALVHHGGIGTSSQAMRAGVPQLVMPMSYDQPDNAHRMAQLGIAASLSPRRFRAPAVAAALERLFGAEEVAAACREVAGRLVGSDGLGLAADLLERDLTENVLAPG